MGKMMAVLSATVILAPGAWAGPDWLEGNSGDAGSMPGTAQVTQGSGALERIRGGLSATATPGTADFEDMYLIRISDPSSFAAETYLNGSAEFNTQLWLFDAQGFGVLGQDDAATAGLGEAAGVASGSLLLPTPDDGSPPLGPGLYYLAISGFDDDPASVSGPIFFQASTQELSGPDGPGGQDPIFDWEVNVGPEVGAYVIELSGARFASVELCPADVDGDGVVAVSDMVMVLLDWGASGGAADIDSSGIVDVSDLVELLLAWGPCPEPGATTCPGEGDCFAPHATTGCADQACCQALCAGDPFCCEVGWDEICAAAAMEACAGAPDCPGEGNCFVAHTGAGCDCEECCALICAGDPFCCEVEWDEICADDAAKQCDCPGPCPGEGDCAVPDQTPGCADAACCLLVCDIDPYCCEVEWDEYCASTALDECQLGEPCPGEGDCFSSNETPGCSDTGCCTLVCEIDPFCCVSMWDQICADEAVKVCGPPCDLQCEAWMSVEPEFCGEDLNGGCNSTPPQFGAVACGETVCGTAWSDGGTRDTDWYLIAAEGSSGCLEIRASLAAEFAGQVFVVGGAETCNPVVLGERGDGSLCAATAPAVASVPPGTYLIFVSTAGFDGFPCGAMNDYQLSVTCAPAAPEACGP